jgi:bifunctional aspartokinase / homoserine dehydrogenase 1
MKVLKFGGSSVGTAESIEKVKEIIRSGAREQLLVVFSAFGDTTDYLLESGKKAEKKDKNYLKIIKKIDALHLDIIEKIFDNTNKAHVISEVKETLNHLEEILEGVFNLEELSLRTFDKITSFGELLSNYILAEYLKQAGLDIKLHDSRKIITTENVFGGARILIPDTYKNIKKIELKSQINIFPGYISSAKNGDATTLGRGGSDYTASLLAGALKADELQIWKDVNGMLTANPKLVQSAKTIPHLSYDEALELSHFGANILYPPTVQPALINNIPIRIKNTFNPKHEGTLITNSVSLPDLSPVRGLSSITDVALLTITGSEMFGLPGFSKRFFEAISNKGVNIVMITQGSSEHSITVAMLPMDLEKAKETLSAEFKYEISNKLLKPIQTEKELSIIALVGSRMKNYPGISGRMFSTLGKNGINIRAIAQGSSETNITCVVNKSDLEKAMNVLNEVFFEKEIKELNLFVVGVGNVGGKLVEQIASQQEYLLENKLLRINIVGLTNSKKMWLNKNGISLKNWKNELENEGEKSNLSEYIKQIKQLNLRNSIFIDNTANETVAGLYEQCLESSIGIVTCNKIAASDSLVRYKKLKQLSRDKNAPYLFETNVGAGLPIIETLNSLVNSGDRIRKIKAVLSGSLNFIFNNFNEKTHFHDIVKQAQTEGYTEPDPRLDLSGKDVMRKILILAREAGNDLEMNDIKNSSFLSKEYFEGSVAEFYKLLEKNTNFFNDLLQDAIKNQAKLKFVASFENGKASVGLEKITNHHPFYDLQGKDNIVMLYTDRYPEQPLIIKGAGAGADVTASGVFADIIRYSTI